MSHADSWEQTDPILRAICETVLTPKELEVVKLMNAGYGVRRIANALRLDKKTITERLDRAERKINKALEASDEGGA